MNSSKNILVLTYWNFEDALIQTYTLPYLKIIADIITADSNVYLVTLNRKNSSINFSHPKIKVLAFKYIPFGIWAIFYYAYMLMYLWYFIYARKITHIHVWCTPAGAFGYILSVLTHRPLMIDSYEPHAEAMVEVGEWKRNALAFKLLFWFEKKMTHRAKYLIATTESMIKEYAAARFGFNPQKNNWFVKPACVDFNLFKPDEALRKEWRKMLGIENKIVGLYAGKFGGIYLEDEVFQWLKTAQDFWKDKFIFLLLSSHTRTYIMDKCREFKINEKNILHYFVPHQEVVKYMNIADFAITPVKPVYTKKFCSPIKDGEYWAMGLPVIITKAISDDSDIIEKNKIGYVLKSLNENEYKISIAYIDKLLQSNIKNSIRTISKHIRNIQNYQYIYQKIYSG